MDSLQVTDDQSAAVAVAPRITKKFIEDQLKHIVFATGDTLIAGGTVPHLLKSKEGPWDGELPAPDHMQQDYEHHTICMLTTMSGFTVIGHSAPVSPENFNAALGRQLAYENAFRQLWPLFAFAMLEAENIGVPKAGYLARTPF